MTDAASATGSFSAQPQYSLDVLEQRLSRLEKESYDLANRRITRVHPHVRKSLGQYFTPPEIASLFYHMAHWGFIQKARIH